MFSLIWNLGLLEFSFYLTLVLFYLWCFELSSIIFPFTYYVGPMLLNQVTVNCVLCFHCHDVQLHLPLQMKCAKPVFNLTLCSLCWVPLSWVSLCTVFSLTFQPSRYNIVNLEMTILSISKCLSSPDSFILNVRVKNEEDFYRKMGDTMDLSNLPRNHSFYDNTNEKGNFFFIIKKPN